MGVNLEEAKGILALKSKGWLGNEILCLGRPELFVDRNGLQRLSDGFALGWSRESCSKLAAEPFGEPFLEACGFKTVRSLDFSDYEGADIVHDLNLPLPAEFEAISSFVYDGGTIEHVFNVAQALQNVMKLTKLGGTMLLSSPANGQCGHGFYQFSPELFYRVLEANGFVDVQVYLVALLEPARWYRAVDPRRLRQRIQFLTSEPMQMLVMARKQSNFEIFTTPQQSDYADLQWGDSAKPKDPGADGVRPHAEWHTRRAHVRAFIRDRLVYPASVVARHLTGIGSPGLWRRTQFVKVDPFHLDLSQD